MRPAQGSNVSLSRLSRLRRSVHRAQLSAYRVVAFHLERVRILFQMALEFFEPRILLPFELGVTPVIDLS